MSTGSSKKGSNVYVMPDRFSFGLENRKAVQPEFESSEALPVKPPEHGASAQCTHAWEELPGELQTLEEEGKTIWKCHNCGRVTNTYSWDKP